VQKWLLKFFFKAYLGSAQVEIPVICSRNV